MKVLFGTTLAFAVLLTACQGANPFKMQANPNTKYPNLAQANTPVSATKGPVTPDADNTQNVCYSPFTVNVENDQGNKLLLFTEDTPASYVIHITSDRGNTFTVTTPDKPDGLTFNGPVPTGANTADYTVSWTPGKIVSTNGKPYIKLLTLHYSASNSAICGNKIEESLNLQVSKSDGTPVLSFVNFPQTAIQYGQNFKFQIQVNDPASTKSSPPNLNRAEFEAWMQSAEHPNLDASSAVDCDLHGTFVKDTTWSFNCLFDSTKISSKAFLNSGATIDGVFFETAISTRGDKPSIQTPAPKVAIEFPAPTPAPAPVAAAPAVETKVVTPDVPAKAVAVAAPKPAAAPAPFKAATTAAPAPDIALDASATATPAPAAKAVVPAAPAKVASTVKKTTAKKKLTAAQIAAAAKKKKADAATKTATTSSVSDTTGVN